MPISTAMMPITTSSSTSVNARTRRRVLWIPIMTSSGEFRIPQALPPARLWPVIFRRAPRTDKERSIRKCAANRSGRGAGGILHVRMQPRPTRRTDPQPRIALFLLESKKDILLGIAKYVREFGPWRLFLQPTESGESLPQWLRSWRGDGIIGRITDRATAKLVRGTGLPFVDVRGT